MSQRHILTTYINKYLVYVIRLDMRDSVIINFYSLLILYIIYMFMYTESWTQRKSNYKFFTGRCLDRQEAPGEIYLGLKACHFALKNTQWLQPPVYLSLKEGIGSNLSSKPARQKLSNKYHMKLKNNNSYTRLQSKYMYMYIKIYQWTVVKILLNYKYIVYF